MPVKMQLTIYFDHEVFASPTVDGTNGRPQRFGAVDSAASHNELSGAPNQTTLARAGQPPAQAPDRRFFVDMSHQEPISSLETEPMRGRCLLLFIINERSKH